MFVIITYDVNTQTSEGCKRLRQIAKQCVNYGQRVQNSVFECVIEPADFAILKHRLIKIMDKKTDSIRFYNLGNKYENRIECFGVNKSFDMEGVMII
ncbi:MAG: CRISPR-associated endonuclease Cas2 [Clostridiaceae bacterium]|nr:CRISPR-associated endonuclease Cas2 [Clostridiaceae bacterium]